MPKIRGVKPELWTDENFVELSPFARLLWIGLWNHACDNGHLQDKSKQIKMRVLPTDDVNCAELLREIEAQGLIERSGGWITIPNLSHHQKPHKRWFTTCDRPGCQAPEGSNWGNPKRKSTVEQPLNNRGATGGQPFDVDVDGDVDGEGEVNTLSDESDAIATEPDRFEEFWETYGKKVDKKAARQKWLLALRKPGVTADLLISAAAAYVLWERTHNDNGRYVMGPAKWLLNERWADERPARPAPRTNTQQHLALAQQLAADEDQQVIPFRQIGDGR